MQKEKETQSSAKLNKYIFCFAWFLNQRTQLFFKTVGLQNPRYMMFAIHITLIPSGKVFIQLFFSLAKSK